MSMSVGASHEGLVGVEMVFLCGRSTRLFVGRVARSPVIEMSMLSPKLLDALCV